MLQLGGGRRRLDRCWRVRLSAHTSNETSNGPRRTGQLEGPPSRTIACHIAGLNSTNRYQPDGAGLPGRPSVELRVWSGNRLEVRVLSPALAAVKTPCSRSQDDSALSGAWPPGGKLNRPREHLPAKMPRLPNRDDDHPELS